MDIQLETVQNVKAFQYQDSAFEEVTIPISTEYGITIAINGKPFVTIACSGSELVELATGFLVSEGIITSKSEIEGILFDEKNLTMHVTTKETDAIVQRLFTIRSIVSGCGNASQKFEGLKKLTPPEVSPETIIQIGKQFYQTSELHKLTHGVHSAGLYKTTGECIAFYDEIGRHSAIDKLVGYAVYNDIPLNDKIVYSTGRISGEIIQKAIVSGFPIIATKGSPTSLAIQLANEYNVMLIAKVRVNRFSVFTTSIDLKSVFGVGLTLR
ncbi:MAG: formate dehydrogenase accessory sulfurtransferase FdhD [Spirochaetota bacterium]|jgi:FdhD protein|nr:formate dehydrogenase accessory sulfurtransferase FdhD [Spirochaetota bacterium]